MAERKRSIGIYLGGAGLWGLALVYFVAFSSSSSDIVTVRAAEPPIPVATEDAAASSEVTRSRTSRLLDAIRPSRLLRRRKAKPEPQRLNAAQADGASSIPMKPVSQQLNVQQSGENGAVARAIAERAELPVEVLQTAASIPERINPEPDVAYPVPTELAMADLINQTPEEAWAKSWGCAGCHKESHDPHMSLSLIHI